MSDIKLFRVSPQGIMELQGRSMGLERSLQSLMENNLEVLLGVCCLASEYSTGAKHKGRIDTLGIDENGCPVIIEYKRNINENVINQGLFYLDWLMDHKAEFKLLVLERFDKKTAENIEWGGPRLLCIAGDFTRYDEHAVLQMNRNIELIRYRHYPDGFLVLERVNAVTAEIIPEIATFPVALTPHIKTKQAYTTVSQYLERAPGSVKDLYQSVEDLLLTLGDDVEKKVLKFYFGAPPGGKFYFAFKRIKNIACVEVRVQALCVVAYLKCPITPDTIIEGFTRDVSNIGHFGTGDLEVTIRTKEDIERARHLFEMSYQAN
jgi:predicted transport protein